MPETLVIFTIGYPYGDTEVTFLHEEVKVLASHYKEIVLIPGSANTKLSLNKLPKNVRVLAVSRQNTFKWNLADFFIVVKLFLNEVLLSKNLRLVKNVRYHLHQLMNYLALAKSVDELIKTGKIFENDLFYTYWFDEWSSALSILKLQFKRKIIFVTRAHGFDIYDERSDKGYIFPRSIQMKNVKKVYCISKNGKDYLTSKFPGYHDKCEFSRLGIEKSEEVPQVGKRSNGLVIVSCSSLIPLKRVHKIIEILSHSKKNITWIHFGSGALKDEIITMASKLTSNITTDFRGSVKNELIKEFYNNNHVDWFINVSEYEGIPVSIMEAMSYGIPTIATNVGGVNEIVNETTGVLINKNFKPEEVTSVLETVKFSEKQRASIIAFWRTNYKASVNYENFAKKLLSIKKQND